LHLANIVLISGKPVLFDAIEFDPMIASVDVLYDLAFTMMDFIRYDRHAAASALLNRYLGKTSGKTLDALATLPLFMSLRAVIRANVLLARLGRAGRDKADVLQSAGAYFELAHLTIFPPAPTLVTIGGLSGTGKTVLACAIAPDVMPQPGAVVLRTDILRRNYFRSMKPIGWRKAHTNRRSLSTFTRFLCNARCGFFRKAIASSSTRCLRMKWRESRSKIPRAS
jgi:hypothetical protein